MLGDVVRDFGLTLGLPDMALDARGRLSLTLGNGEAALALALEHVPEGLLFGLGRLRTLFPPDAEEQALRLCAHMDMRPLLRPARSDNASSPYLWLISLLPRADCRTDALCACLTRGSAVLEELQA